MKYYIQFLSTKTPDSSPAFIVHFDSQRYLFNCSEGTQRLINENKIHLGKIKNLFFTRSIWGNIGGMPGMVLTLADSGTKEFGVHGPRNLMKCFVGSRNFLQRSQVNFRVHEFLSSNEKYVDENLTIIPVPIYSSKVSEKDTNFEYTTLDNSIINKDSTFKRKITIIDNLKNSNILNRKLLRAMFSGKPVGTLKNSKIFRDNVEIPYTSEITASNFSQQETSVKSVNGSVHHLDNNEKDKKPISSSTTNMSPPPLASATSVHLSLEDYRNSRIKQPKTTEYSLCYICQSHKVPGKFNPKKAKELGVPPGKQFGLLAKGECVTTANGTIVRPEQVKEPDKVSSIFIVIDCPSLDHIPSVINNSAFKEEDVLKRTKNIIHILGEPSILKDERYKAWMNQFPENCNHFIACRNYCSEHVNFLSNCYMQYKLSQVDPESFPLLYFNNEIKESLTSDPQLPKHVISACNNLQIHIEPTEKIDYSHVKENFNLKAIPAKISDKLKNNAEAIQSLKSNIDQWRTENPFQTFPTSTDIEVVTLGTGSALPSKYRNVSSTIILSKRNGNVILDAGEGTLGQICRHFGSKQTFKIILPAVRLIFVSHIHADHHLGMINILSTMVSMGRSSDNLLYIIAPEKFIIWLEEYSCIQDIGLSRFIRVVPSYLFFKKFVDVYSNYYEMLNYLNMSSIETVPVMHVRGACSIVFDYKDCGLELKSSSKSKPIRIAYSGDCRPNREFIRAGMNADLLIHESTFESELEYEAVKKFHCTINEACTVGRCMRAKFLLLTHFSQRYPKVPLFPVYQSNDFSIDLLYSPIFDVLPASAYIHQPGVRDKNIIFGNMLFTEPRSFSETTTSSLSSSSTNSPLSTPSNSAPASPSNSVSVLGSGTYSIAPPPPIPHFTMNAVPTPLSIIKAPSMLIPTETGLSPQQVIPTPQETISQIRRMIAMTPEDPNYQMRIGMAVDHFHLRLGYDEYCMEWITEAMRLLIPDDEEEEDDDDGFEEEEVRIFEVQDKIKKKEKKENENKRSKGTKRKSIKDKNNNIPQTGITKEADPSKKEKDQKCSSSQNISSDMSTTDSHDHSSEGGHSSEVEDSIQNKKIRL